MASASDVTNKGAARGSKISKPEKVQLVLYSYILVFYLTIYRSLSTFFYKLEERPLALVSHDLSLHNPDYLIFAK